MTLPMLKSARGSTALAALLTLSLIVLGLALGPAGAASAPSVSVTKGPYHNGQFITVTVGPNRLFKAYSHVNILECADPGGKKKNLPKSVAACDGDTIQGDTVLIKKDGSFSERRYQVFALPNVSTLGELPTGQPACSKKKSCVLYIGQNQINFSAPKVFSKPFVVLPASKKT